MNKKRPMLREQHRPSDTEPVLEVTMFYNYTFGTRSSDLLARYIAKISQKPAFYTSEYTATQKRTTTILPPAGEEVAS